MLNSNFVRAKTRLAEIYSEYMNRENEELSQNVKRNKNLVDVRGQTAWKLWNNATSTQVTTAGHQSLQNSMKMPPTQS